MDRAEFDRFADEYRAVHATNIAASGESPEYFAEYKMRDFADEVRHAQIESQARWFLDFGTGIGNALPYFARYLPDAWLCGVDVSTRSLDIARTRAGSKSALLAFDGKTLPFADGTFAGAFACCVFHHIPHGEHLALLSELRRVMAPGALLMIYEHNPWNPLTVRAVKNCPFDENARLLSASALRSAVKNAGFNNPRTRYRVFFPAMLGALRPLETLLKAVPLGAQYYILARR
ncbi:MAG: class I SAM-dependent methyltransferase [Sutterellaceae bacterium]|nr:class I SAM-dependent methyltransferase [Burkholderiaceae bacterium]MDW8429689.1 class I SAM-dependent methyltransferase [Sutterellaceae bacterium]